MSRRAAQLTRPAARAAAARGLERMVHEARAPRQTPGGPVPVRRNEVLFAEPALLAVIHRLGDDTPVSGAAVAEIRVMLADGAGPFFVQHGHDIIRLWARSVLTRLDAHGR